MKKPPGLLQLNFSTISYITHLIAMLMSGMGWLIFIFYFSKLFYFAYIKLKSTTFCPNFVIVSPMDILKELSEPLVRYCYKHTLSLNKAGSHFVLSVLSFLKRIDCIWYTRAHLLELFIFLRWMFSYMPQGTIIGLNHFLRYYILVSLWCLHIGKCRLAGAEQEAARWMLIFMKLESSYNLAGVNANF